ncbi:MAG TPA: class I SAM-dependent methyltransferase [Bacteroidia bacterium]|nr:class I SAM-dependent methyltransferase [Bacteroidia bacterium]
MSTAERVSATDSSDNYVLQRSIFAYLEAAKMVKGQVLEIGTGSGYGVKYIAPVVDKFVTIDKFVCDVDFKTYPNVQFLQMTVPPFKGIADNTFDFVVTFQVIEHIVNDDLYVKEIARVLKPGGKLIVTTPNRHMSLSRNPWHIREYKPNELVTLLKKHFKNMNTQGVYGNKVVMDYYEKNKESVNKIMKYDVLNLQWILPRQILQIPYDIMNRRNRKKLLESNTDLTAGIKSSDFFLKEVDDASLDLFYIAEK